MTGVESSFELLKSDLANNPKKHEKFKYPL